MKNIKIPLYNAIYIVVRKIKGDNDKLLNRLINRYRINAEKQ